MFCEKCGNKLSEGDAFCEKCGAPVPQENSVATEDNGVNQNNQQFTQPVNFDNNANVTEGVQQAAQPYQVQSQPKVKKPSLDKACCNLRCGSSCNCRNNHYTLHTYSIP